METENATVKEIRDTLVVLLLLGLIKKEIHRTRSAD